MPVCLLLKSLTYMTKHEKQFSEPFYRGIELEGYNSDKIASLLKGYCADFPSIQQECFAIVQQNITQIVQQLSNGADEESVCINLQLCDSSPTTWCIECCTFGYQSECPGCTCKPRKLQRGNYDQ